jgi:hypothetical protein
MFRSISLWLYLDLLARQLMFGNGLSYFKNISNLLSLCVLVSADVFNLQTWHISTNGKSFQTDFRYSVLWVDTDISQEDAPSIFWVQTEGYVIRVLNVGFFCACSFQTIAYDWVQWNFWNVKDLKSRFLIIEDESSTFHRNVGANLQNSSALIRRRLAS